MSYDRLRKKVNDTRILSVDLETTGTDVDTCEILLVAMSSGKSAASSVSVAVEPTDPALCFLRETLETPDIRVVGHNILKFDLPVLIRRGVVKKENIKATVLDTLPLVWLLDENKPLGLKQAVKRYFDYNMTTYEEAYLTSPELRQLAQCTQKIKELETYVAETLDKAVKKHALSHKKKLIAEGELDRERCLIVDIKPPTKKAIAEKAKEAAAIEAARFREAEIRRVADEKESLAVESGHRRTAAQHAQRRYARDDARQTLRLYHFCVRNLRSHGLLRWAEVENTVRAVTRRMEEVGVVVERAPIKEIDDLLTPLIEEFEGEVYNIAKREFGLNSNKVLAEVIYDDLCVPQIGKITIGKNGKEKDERRSTKESILARMLHPIGQAVLNYRTALKLKTSFTSKLLGLIDASPTGRIHPTFNPTVRTGRWSCKEPNLQQIPGRAKAATYAESIQRLGPQIRAAFCPPPGHSLIVADLSQIELRLAGHFTDDAVILATYNQATTWNGMRMYTGDLHQKTADSLGVTRSTAKTINFGLLYGISAEGFASRFKIFKPGTKTLDVELTAKYREDFFNLMAGVEQYLGKIRISRMGPFPRTHYTTIAGRYRRFPKDEQAAPGKIFNSIIQGSAADILKAHIASIFRDVINTEEFAGTELVLQAHDEVALYAPEDIADLVGIMVKYIMEAPWFCTDVPILSSTKICRTWAERSNDSVPEVGVVPPPETGIVPCVAMLTDEQRAWASSRVHVEDMSVTISAGE